MEYPIDFKFNPLELQPVKIEYHVPPYIWKADPSGHIGNFDLFFWVPEGEFALLVDNDFYIVREGQLAFLPRGKMRKYAQISKNISIYEMRFLAEYQNENVMETLGLTGHPHVVTVTDKEEMTKLFENSNHNEMNRKIPCNIPFCSNLLRIINIFFNEVAEQRYSDANQFAPVIEYMRQNLNKTVTIDELSSVVHTQSTYFIRKFKKAFGITPLVYFCNMRIHKAMELLLSTDDSIDVIAKTLGIDDTSYFARWFKKTCNLTPSEYRKIFGKR